MTCYYLLAAPRGATDPKDRSPDEIMFSNLRAKADLIDKVVDGGAGRLEGSTLKAMRPEAAPPRGAKRERERESSGAPQDATPGAPATPPRPRDPAEPEDAQPPSTPTRQAPHSSPAPTPEAGEARAASAYTTLQRPRAAGGATAKRTAHAARALHQHDAFKREC